MADGPQPGLSVWAVAAIVCNSVAGVLILLLFAVLYKACQVPSKPPDGTTAFFPVLEPKTTGEGKYQLVVTP